MNFTPLFRPRNPGVRHSRSSLNLQSSKTRNRQDIRAEPQTVFAIVNYAVPGLSVFYSLAASTWQSRVRAIPGAYLLGSTARIHRDVRAHCSCSFELRCCRAECVLLLGFNVQSDIFADMIAWS